MDLIEQKRQIVGNHSVLVFSGVQVLSFSAADWTNGTKHDSLQRLNV